jgi:RNase P/RNase MRP subunit p29
MKGKLNRLLGRLMLKSALMLGTLLAMSSVLAPNALAAYQVQQVPASMSITDWRGEYYGNTDLIGAPLVRNDAQVNFDWGTSSPMAGIPVDNFSVRWTRQLDFAAGTYLFHVRVDDGARLWVDGQLLINEWHNATFQTYTAQVTLTKGAHDIRLEMFERTGLASVALWWEAAPSYPQWKGEYFNNTNLSGSPVVIRNDADINFNWGTGAPAARVPADNFGVRWTRQLYFAAGTYRFTVAVDDGARLWVDGQLLINQWHDGTATYSADVSLAAGVHTIRLEMYEHLGGAEARLSWVAVNSYPDWKGSYFSNPNLQGSPVLVRNDKKIDFRWGKDAPANGVPAEGFSVRWVRWVKFDQGVYQFCAVSDDGVRVFIDGKPIINEWHDSSGDTYCANVAVSKDTHKVKVEYYNHLERSVIRVWWDKLP